MGLFRLVIGSGTLAARSVEMVRASPSVARRHVGLISCGVLSAACQARAIAAIECEAPDTCPIGEECDSTQGCPTATVTSPGTLLEWDGDAYVSANNPFGIKGTWGRTGDCSEVEAAQAAGTFVCPENPPTPGCCTQLDTDLVGPDGEPGWHVEGGQATRTASKICVRGIASQQLDGVDGMPAYSATWGASLALPLRDWLAFDATTDFPGGTIRGFSVDLAGPPSSEITFGVTMLERYEVYGAAYFVPTAEATLILDELEPPEWVTPQIALDPSRLWTLSFGVTVGTAAPTPFDFCVSNLRVLQ